MTEPGRHGPARGEPHAPRALITAFAEHDYLLDRGLATAFHLALRLGRPLLLEGDAGVGKTDAARALAAVLDAELVRLQCYEGLDRAESLYAWDHPRQLLHLRALELSGQRPAEHEDELYTERFLLARPLLRALRSGGDAVLLVDEIDRADDEFEAFLLELLGDGQITIPELGTIRAPSPPIVVLTSNRTRELSDALRRRCLYHWIDHPSADQELAILRLRAAAVPDRLARHVVAVVQRLRQLELHKPPGVAETIDWATSIADVDHLDAEVARDTLGTMIKDRDDLDRVRGHLDDLVAEVVGGGPGP